MADRRTTRAPRRRPASPVPRRRPEPRRRPQAARPRPRQKQKQPGLFTRWLDQYRRRKNAEFRPDSLEPGLLKKIYMTKLQRLHLLRWTLYVLMCVAMLVIQDVIMSRASVFGATTDLCAALILLITVMEGVDIGSIFVLVASTLFYFSGSAPGPFAVALMSIFGILATLFRQAYWHRNKASVILCAGIALMLYELGVYAVGVVMGLTNWYRIDTFLITGLLSWAVMLLLYPLMDRIGQIGGHIWKE